jgi:hypothetical protein
MVERSLLAIATAGHNVVETANYMSCCAAVSAAVHAAVCIFATGMQAAKAALPVPVAMTHCRTHCLLEGAACALNNSGRMQNANWLYIGYNTLSITSQSRQLASTQQAVQ